MMTAIHKTNKDLCKPFYKGPCGKICQHISRKEIHGEKKWRKCERGANYEFEGEPYCKMHMKMIIRRGGAMGISRVAFFNPLLAEKLQGIRGPVTEFHEKNMM
jgi:hypothetical protein